MRADGPGHRVPGPGGEGLQVYNMLSVNSGPPRYHPPPSIAIILL